MNKRIEELKEQARDFYLDRDDLTCSVQELHRLVEEKFAELIVLECIDAISNDTLLSDVRSASNGCIRTIKRHFGVE